MLLAWSNTWSAPFEFDDHASIIDNASIRQLWPATWLRPPATAGETVGGRPLLNLTFALNYAVHRLEVGGYHAVNLLIHVAAALTLFGVVRRTFALLRPAAHAEDTAWAGGVALLWALHPLQTESVTYIVQRAESLGALWCLLALYAFIRGTAAPAAIASRWYCAAVAGALLGVATKETAVVIPLLALLWDRTFVAGSFSAAWQRRGKVYVGLFASWLLSAFLLMGAGGNRGGTYAFTLDAIGLSWITQFKAVACYLRLVVWPHPLVFDRAFFQLGITDAWPYIALLAPLLAITGWGLWRRTATGFALAVFFILLAPTSLLPAVLQVIVEHRMYLALAAPLALVVAWGRVRAPRFTAVGIGLGAVALGVATYGRNQVYRSELTLWAHTAAEAPDNPRARYNHGLALAAAGRTEEALREFGHAIEVQPNHAFARFELGKAALLAGRWPEAAAWFETVVQIDPAYLDARLNLAQALVRSGRPADGIGHYQRALADHPDREEIRPLLATAYRVLGQAQMAGDPVEAEKSLREALRLGPASADTAFLLGNLLARQRRFTEAIDAYQSALTVDSSRLDARSNLANCLLFVGRIDEAITEYETVLAARPGDARIRENLRLAREARLGR